MSFEVKALRYDYGDHMVLDGIDLPIVEGEIIGILG